MNTELDPRRVSAAEKRAGAALAAAKYHEQQATKERSKADSLARTWGFDLTKVTVKP